MINENFASLRGQDVVLYGMGQLTRILLEAPEKMPFNIVGIMDRLQVDGTFMGYPVLSPDNVRAHSQNILLTACLSNCRIIHTRIKDLETKGIKIYFPNGECVSERRQNNSEPGYYLRDLKSELKKAIDQNDLISFDIFDTLIMRKFLMPHLLFNALEKKSGKAGLAELRKEAETVSVAKLGAKVSIDDFYSCIIPNLPTQCSNKNLMELELELEKQYISLRPDIMELFEYAKSQGKTVVLSSDMYINSDRLGSILENKGITGYQKLLVSCDLKSSKAEGGLFNLIKKDNPQSQVLHIGDNLVTDYYQAQKNELSAVKIKSSLELLGEFGLDPALQAALGFDDHLAIGLVLNKLLHISHKDSGYRPTIEIKGPRDLGYCFFGALTYSFLCWLAENARDNGDEQILFLSRDGYLWVDIYNKYVRPKFPGAPQGIYFYSSRRALSGAAVHTAENLKMCLELYFIANIKVSELLESFFGFSVSPDDFNQLSCSQTNSEELLNYIQKKYLRDILDNGKKERRNYLKYIANSGLDLKRGKVGFVDGLTTLKSALLLEKIIGVPANIYFMGNHLESSRYKERLQKLKPHSFYTGDYNSAAPTHKPLEMTCLCESIFTAPQSQLINFKDDGSPVFFPEDSRDFKIIHEVHTGIKEFSSDFFNDGLAGPSKEVAAFLFDNLFAGPFTIAETLKDNIIFIESFMKIKEKVL